MKTTFEQTVTIKYPFYVDYEDAYDSIVEEMSAEGYEDFNNIDRFLGLFDDWYLPELVFTNEDWDIAEQFNIDKKMCVGFEKFLKEKGLK